MYESIENIDYGNKVLDLYILNADINILINLNMCIYIEINFKIRSSFCFLTIKYFYKV